MREITLDQAPRVLASGEILIYPTETLYGLGVDIRNGAALDRLIALKGRDPKKPVSLLVASKNELFQVAEPLSPLAERLWDGFFPGPLTLVVPAAAGLDARIHGGTGWVGIRCSSSPWVRDLLARWRRPLTTTSANLSGAGGATRVLELWRDFGDIPGVALLNGGDLPPSRGSTVVKVEGERLIEIREGEIPFAELKIFIEKNR